MLIMEKLMRTLMIALLTVLPISANAGAVIGDVNGDGKVSIADVAALIDYLLRSAENEDMYVYGDVNNDNVVNIGDVSSLIDILLAGQGDEPQAQVITETITANGVTFTMVLVECGTFTMGATAEQLDEALLNEYPAHEVTLTNNYYICQTHKHFLYIVKHEKVIFDACGYSRNGRSSACGRPDGRFPALY